MKKLEAKHKSLLIIGLTSIVLLGFPVAIWAINTQNEGFQTTTSYQEIRAHSDCKRVRHTGLKSYFIPTKTRNEAEKALNNPPNDLEIASCGGGGGKK